MSARSPMPEAAPVRADQDAEFRKSIARTINDHWDRITGPALDNAAIIGVPGTWRRSELCAEFAKTLAVGPLATLRAERDKLAAELREAREERRGMIDDYGALVMRKVEQRLRAEAAEANLIALAKMYGEACSELQVLRALAQDVADEADDAEYDGFLLTPDPHQAAGSASGKEETDADRR